MSSVSPLADWLAAQGIWWPQGDGDALRDASGAWSAMADLIDDTAQVLEATASGLGGQQGSAVQAFSDYWQSWSGTDGYLPVASAYCRQLAAALSGFATDVDTADRAVTAAVELALEQNLVPSTTAALPPLDATALAYLQQVTAQLGAALGAAAGLATADTGVSAQSPLTVALAGDLQGASLSQIAWPTLGTAPDLSALASTTVDFGSGQGDLQTVGAAPSGADSGAGTVTVTIDGSTATVTPSSTSTVTFSVGGDTVTVTPIGGTGAPSPVVALPPTSQPAIAPSALVATHATAAPVAVTPPRVTAPTSAGGGSLSFPSLGGSAGSGAFSLPATSPVAVPASGHISNAAAEAAGAAGLGSATTAAVGASAVAKARTASSMPFLPMGAMGAGGGGGDDGEEPARRKRR